ncbi:MAG: hypothetical protein D5R97_00770, partial [Candidatus Syntrophonatronum acetioxidans]
KVNWEKIKEIVEENVEYYNETGDKVNLPYPEYVIFTEDMTIVDVFSSECMRFDVDPIEYYGDYFTKSKLFKDFQTK